MEAQATGSSMLTDGMPPPPQADGTPAPSLSPAEAALQQVQDGPPEWAPAKYWDPNTKSVKYEELGKGYQSLEKLLGREKVPVPTGDDDQEGWERLYRAAGKPEKPDDYEFERPDRMPEDLAYDEDTEKNFRAWAHANGLNKKQAKALYDGYVKTQIERHGAWHDQQKQVRATAEMALRREYGGAYEGKLQLAKTALREFADPDYLKYLDESGRGNDPREIRAWIRIGEKMGGDTRLKGRAENHATVADAKKAVSEFRSKNEKVLYDKGHPDHKRMTAEMNKLYEAAYPEQAGML
jgi:hypothetical protein